MLLLGRLCNPNSFTTRLYSCTKINAHNTAFKLYHQGDNLYQCCTCTSCSRHLLGYKLITKKVTVGGCLLGCCERQSDSTWRKFQRYLLPPSSGRYVPEDGHLHIFCRKNLDSRQANCRFSWYCEADLRSRLTVLELMQLYDLCISVEKELPILNCILKFSK
jgi:hypothetical protein